MPDICVFPGCQNKRSFVMKTNLSFHKIPKDDPLRSKWLKAIGKPDWDPSYSTTICSEHFKEDDLFLSNQGLRRLTKSAVPSSVPLLGKDSGSISGKRKRLSTGSPKNSTDSDNVRPTKKIKLTGSIAGQIPKENQAVKFLPNGKPNEKQTQTHSGDWCRTTQNNSQKSVQAIQPKKSDEYWYGNESSDVPELNNIHCTTTEEHKARYRIDILFNEMKRLGEIKNKQNNIIALLKHKHKQVSNFRSKITEIVIPERNNDSKVRADGKKVKEIHRPGLTVMGTARKTYMEQSESELPVVYVSNMDVQCIANQTPGK